MQTLDDNGLLGSQLLSIPADILEHNMFEQYAQSGYASQTILARMVQLSFDSDMASHVRYHPPFVEAVGSILRQWMS